MIVILLPAYNEEESLPRLMPKIKETLEKLNHNFDLWLGESDVNHLIPDLLKSLKEKKKIIEDDGAYISAMDSDPKILITKSDGSYLYLTTDLATVKNRLSNESFDKTLYVVDSRQKFHFEQLFKSLDFFEFPENIYSSTPPLSMTYYKPGTKLLNMFL